MLTLLALAFSNAAGRRDGVPSDRCREEGLKFASKCAHIAGVVKTNLRLWPRQKRRSAEEICNSLHCPRAYVTLIAIHQNHQKRKRKTKYEHRDAKPSSNDVITLILFSLAVRTRWLDWFYSGTFSNVPRQKLAWALWFVCRGTGNKSLTPMRHAATNALL